MITIGWGGDFVEGTAVVVKVPGSAKEKFQLVSDEWTLGNKSASGDLFMTKPAEPTVMIGDKGYADLNAALVAVDEGGEATITLLADQEISSRVNIKDKNITITGEGKAIKRAASYTNGLVFLTQTPSEGMVSALTLDGVTLDGQNVESTAAFIEASNKGTTTLKDITIQNVVTTANGAVVNKSGGKLVMKGTIVLPSLFVGTGVVADATEATISSAITLNTDANRPYGLIIEGGKTTDYACSTFRLSQQQNGVYIMPLSVAHEYSHPALLHTTADIEAAKTKLSSNDAMYNAAYERLIAQSAGEKTGAVEYLKRMDKANWEGTYEDYSNFTRAASDAKLAYQLALRYRLDGNTSSAQYAVAILNDWATVNKGFLRISSKTNPETGEVTPYANAIPDPNEYLMTIQAYQFANAAELLRDYSGWQAEDFQKFQNWIRQTFADVAILFLENHHNNANSLHYWLNWDLAALNAMLSVGILCNDKALVDYALAYPAKTGEGTGTGTYENAIIDLHQDADSEEMLAQCQESGRDQGHATLDISLLGVLCQTAKNIGTDLFTPYKALEMAEYVGKYNLKKVENNEEVFIYNNVPFTEYTNGDVTHTAISADARGTERPCWELFHAYAKENDKADAYTEAWVKYMRGKNAWGEGESTTTDELGFSTLMFGAEVTATGIKTVQSSKTKVQSYYDLQGRQVANPAKGLYIVNGKKMVVK